MRSYRIHALRAAVAPVIIGGVVWGLPAPASARAADVGSEPTSLASPTTTSAVSIEAKALSDQVKKGLEWLAQRQQADGGWNQGEKSSDQGRSGEQIDKSNVADTCMAALAFLRAGNTPGKGEYGERLQKALDFVCGQVEKSPQEGLFVTDIKGSRVQTKLGQYIDTFAAALLLAEVKDAMPDEAGRKKIIAALDKTMDKIEKNQKADGRWVEANDGWASALCQSMGHKAVNRAAQVGAPVSAPVLEKAQKYAAGNFDSVSGAVGAGGSANVELYARSSNLSSMQESANTNEMRKKDVQDKRQKAATQAAEAQVRADEA
jgi:hypothetical protein